MVAAYVSPPPLAASSFFQDIANKNVQAISLSDSCAVMALGSREQAKAAAFLQRWNLQSKATAYGSYEAVLADPRVDAVYIPLPSALHLHWVAKAAAAGKHVLLDKPICVSPEELDGILGACAAAGVQLLDGTMFMHNPRLHRMEQLIRGGNGGAGGEGLTASPLGALTDVTSVFTFAGE